VRSFHIKDSDIEKQSRESLSTSHLAKSQKKSKSSIYGRTRGEDRGNHWVIRYWGFERQEGQCRGVRGVPKTERIGIIQAEDTCSDPDIRRKVSKRAFQYFGYREMQG
jgi:hypothetical protein